MNNLQSRRIAMVGLAVAIVLALSDLFLGLFFVVGEPFGSMNDAGLGLGAFLGAALAWVSYPAHRARSPRAALVGLAAACVGAIIAALGSVLIILHITGVMLAGWYTALGYALIGVWLVLLCLAAGRAQWFSRRGTIFGLATGALMGLGLVAVSGILTGNDSMVGLPWHLIPGQVSFLGSLLLYPIWCFWLWSYLAGETQRANRTTPVRAGD